MRRAARTLSFAAITALAAPVLAQQVLGNLSGDVTDPSGAVIGGATVTVLSLGTGLTRSTVTNGSGEYQFNDLPGGTYSVTVAEPGFAEQKFPSILIQGDRTATLPVRLATGNVNESTTVNANASLNNSDTTNGLVLSHSQIEDVPLATGSFTQLIPLSPGVSAQFVNSTGTNEGLGNQSIYADGQRATDNTFLVDGVDVSNLFNGNSSSQVASGRAVPNTGESFPAGGSIQTSTSVYDAIGNAIPSPSPEQINEIRINTSMYDAQQGAKSGAHVDVGTLSGSNKVHGQGYVYRGTNALNAAPFFYKQQSAAYGGTIPIDEVNPYLHRVVAGGTLGGPLLRDKVFLFLGYNGVRVTDLYNGRSPLGIPAGLTDDRSSTGIANAVSTSTGAPFTGAINPAAAAILNFKLPNGQYLIPSAPSNAAAILASGQPDVNLISAPTFNADQVTSSLDANLTSKDVVSLKYFYQHDPASNPYTDSSTDGFRQALDSGSQLAAIVNSWTPSSKLSWQQTFGFNRQKAYTNNVQPLTPQQVGINLFGYTAFPGLSIPIPITQNTSQGPQLVETSTLRIGPTGSFYRDGLFQNSFQPRSTVTQTLGRHSLSYGGNFNYTQLNILNHRQNTGTINFKSFQDFVEGNIIPSSAFLQGASNRYYRTKDVGAYVQDKWQVRPNLSLTLGLRYDYDGPFSEKFGNFFNFDPSLYSYNSVSNTITNDGFIIAGNNKSYGTRGVSSSTLKNLQEGFAPRVGFAWTPAANRNKVIFRGGFGLYYNRGEYFSYLSPGAGSGISGPFGVTQEPPFVINAAPPPGADLSNPFGATLPTPPTGNPSTFTSYLPNRTQLLAGMQAFPFGSYAIGNKLPYTENWSFDMQLQPVNDLTLQIGYVGNRGRHGVIPVPFNQAGIATPANPINGETYSYGYQTVDTNGNPLVTEPANTYDGGNTDLRVPYIGYGINSVLYEAAGNSAYDALQLQAIKRISHGLQVTASYTFSHSLDEQSGVGLFYNGSNPSDLRSGYGSSDFDTTNVTSFSFTYTLPNLVHGDGILAKAVNGFGLQNITLLSSGQPYSVEDYSGAVASQYYSYQDGITNPIIPLAPGVSAKQALTGHSGAFYASNNQGALNPGAFQIPFVSPGQNGVPACGPSTGGAQVCDVFETTFAGNGQRNIFRQSFQKRADLSVVKNVPITERVNGRYTLDFFNVTNTPSFDLPNNSIGTGTNTGQQVTYNPALVPTNGQANVTVANQQTAYGGLANNGINVSPALNLGAVQQTIGSSRIVQMSFHLQF